MEIEDYRAFPAAEDERAVISVIADTAPDSDGWRLRHATCLAVPSACAESSWAAWAADQEGEHERRSSAAGLPATFSLHENGWLLARAAPELKDARVWLRQVLGAVGPAGLTTPAIASIPPLRAHLTAPNAAVRAMRLGGEGCGNLISAAVRPAVGVMLRGASQEHNVKVPSHAYAGESFTGWPCHDLTGIHVTPAGVAAELRTPEGLFVGRLERRAWIIDQRGTPGATHKLARLGWDPTSVDPSGLVLQIEEFDDFDELIMSQRIAFADLDLNGVSGSPPPYEVRLPSIGPKLRHGLSLYAADGSLLDRHEPWPFAETVSLAMSFDGSTPIEVTSGVPRAEPAMDERLARSTEVADELVRVRLSGARARVLDRATRRVRLRALLDGARGELLVADPFFGHDEEDWDLVANLTIPVRVLTCRVATTPAPIPAGIEARIRPKGTHVLHDRAYSWQEGGFMLGGSPTTLAPTTLTPLSPTESELRRTMFEALWLSPLFTEVPRR